MQQPSHTSSAGIEVGSVASGQIADIVRVTSEAARAAAEEVLGRLAASGILAKGNFNPVIDSGTVIKSAVAETLTNLIANLVNTRLRPISLAQKLTLKASDGKRTIAQADKSFSFFDMSFKNPDIDVPGEAKPETDIFVHELAEDSTFAQMFGFLSEDLDSLCFSQDQILDFVETHPVWIRSDNCASFTFFLFKAGGEFLVVGVAPYKLGGRQVVCHGFSRDWVWLAKYRSFVVVPQPNQ